MHVERKAVPGVHAFTRSKGWNVDRVLWSPFKLKKQGFGKLCFPGGSAGKESACNLGDQGLIPGLERSPGEGNGYLLQYSGLENFMDYVVRGVAGSQTPLSGFYFHRDLI